MLDFERQEEFRVRRDEMAALELRRSIIVNELNDLAKQVEYGADDYDAEQYWQRTFRDLAYDAGISFMQHRPGSAYTFWIPSSQSC